MMQELCLISLRSHVSTYLIVPHDVAVPSRVVSVDFFVRRLKLGESHGVSSCVVFPERKKTLLAKKEITKLTG